MHHIPLAVQCIYGWINEGGEDGDRKEGEDGDRKEGEDGRGRILPRLLYADDLVLCGESEEDMRVMVGRYVE